MRGAQPLLGVEVVALAQEVAELREERRAVLRVLCGDFGEVAHERGDDLPRGRRGRLSAGRCARAIQDLQEVRLHAGEDLGDEAATLAAERQVRGGDLLEHLLLHGLAAEDQLVRLLVEEPQQVRHALDDLGRETVEVAAELHVGVQELDEREDGRDHDEGQALHVEVAVDPLVLVWVRVGLDCLLLPKQLLENALVLPRHVSSFPALLLQDTLHLRHALLVELLDDALRLGVEDRADAGADVGPDVQLRGAQPLPARLLQAPHPVQGLEREIQVTLPI
mmetsp:Transcript_107942/g.336669  ORF Transcript_107942/g.336669 Transcript_107942/m.336669 type:complete len:279 (-) Transcript_107942:1273-2109(-)